MKPHFSGSEGRRKPPRRKVPKKKVARKSPAPHSGAYRPRPVYGAPSSFSFMTVLLIIIALLLAVAMTMVLTPRSLDFIAGYPSKKSEGVPRNLLAEAQDALVKHTDPVVFTEAEVNQYLRDRIRGRQEGLFGAFVSFEGIYVDFEDGFAETYIVRKIFGIPMTMSTRLAVDNRNDLVPPKAVWSTEGGTIGKIRLKKYQFQPILKAFLSLITQFESETQVVRLMGKVQFQDDKLVLDPNI